MSHQRTNDVGPRSAPGDVEELGARVDDRAVRIAGRDRRQLAGFDRDHRLVEQRHAVGDLAEVDQHATLADAREGDELAVREARTDLAGLDELAVRAGNVAGLEEPHHREPVLEVALLDAVDVRIVEEACAAVDPAAAAAEVTLEAEALRDPRPEVRRPVDGAVVDAQLVGAHPVREAFFVVAGQVGRGGEPVEVVDVELVELDVRQEPVRVAPAVLVARRSRVLDDAHRTPVLLTAGGSGEERLGRLGQGAEEHPHLGDPIALEPVHEGVVRLEGLAVAAERGVLPLGGPAVGADAELLVELDVAVGRFEEGADDLEEPAEARVVAGHRVAGPGGGTRGRR